MPNLLILKFRKHNNLKGLLNGLVDVHQGNILDFTHELEVFADSQVFEKHVELLAEAEISLNLIDTLINTVAINIGIPRSCFQHAC